MIAWLKRILGMSRHQHYATGSYSDESESIAREMRHSLDYDQSRIAEIEAEIALRQRGGRDEHP